MRNPPIRLREIALLAVAVLATAGCSPGRPPEPSTGTVLHVTEQDFHISAASHSPSGDVAFSVRNLGPDNHEFILVREDEDEEYARLPLRPDGVTVDEEELKSETVGVLEPGAPGSVRQLRVNLAPGNYVYFCNMYGHYMAGMHGTLEVR